MPDKKRILIAEDEKPMARALRLKLEREGFDVDIVANGEEALAFIKQNEYALFILDLVMPKKDGFSVLEELKRSNNTKPIIVASNLGQEEDLARAKKLGVQEFLVKSNTSLQTIVQTVKKMLS